MHGITELLEQLLNIQGDSLTGMQAISAVAIAYLGGILSSLTPCVYPLIPVTVSVIGGMQKSHLDAASPRKPLGAALTRGMLYIAGLGMVFSILGVIAGLSGKVFGTLTNTSGWYMTLGIVMTLGSLIMLEVIPFDPAAWIDRTKRKLLHLSGRPHKPRPPSEHKELTWLGAFTLGATSGFIASPCTTPVLTSILAFIAKTQSVVLGLALMSAFSLGLGTLLLLIGFFTGALQILPRSGNWMRLVKLSSGLLLLLFSEYLIYRAGTLGGIS